MNRFRLGQVITVAVSAVLLIAAAVAWAGCGMAACGKTCGSGSHASAMQGGSGACAVGQGQGSSGFLGSYFEMRALLAGDKAKGLDKLSKKLASETGKFRKTLASGSKNNVSTEQLDALKDIQKSASSMKTNDIGLARESFKGLSRDVISYVKQYGCDSSVYSFYCDMVKESWLQETDKIGNPYYGSQMLKCGVMTGHTMDGKYVTGTHDAMGGKSSTGM